MITANDPSRNDLDVETVVDQVWINLERKIPRSTVKAKVIGLFKKYDTAAIKQFVPLLVHREAVASLLSAITENGNQIQ